jgi:hypothetical protein
LQGLLGGLGFGQRFAGSLFRSMHADAAAPQGVEMVALIAHRLTTFALSPRVLQGHALGQSRTAIASQLFEVGQSLELFRPDLATGFGAQAAADPTETFLLDHHQHRSADVEFIAARVTDQRLRHFIKDLEQNRRLLPGSQGAPA